MIEAREARLFYEDREYGLGTRFTHELRRTITRIEEFPLAWPEVDPPIRRILVNRFPYLVHYAAKGDRLTILGVYHARRRPISWRTRMGLDEE